MRFLGPARTHDDSCCFVSLFAEDDEVEAKSDQCSEKEGNDGAANDDIAALGRDAGSGLGCELEMNAHGFTRCGYRVKRRVRDLS